MAGIHSPEPSKRIPKNWIKQMSGVADTGMILEDRLVYST
jgi:hypothetical protein